MEAISRRQISRGRGGDTCTNGLREELSWRFCLSYGRLIFIPAPPPPTWQTPIQVRVPPFRAPAHECSVYIRLKRGLSEPFDREQATSYLQFANRTLLRALFLGLNLLDIAATPHQRLPESSYNDHSSFHADLIKLLQPFILYNTQTSWAIQRLLL